MNRLVVAAALVTGGVLAGSTLVGLAQTPPSDADTLSSVCTVINQNDHFACGPKPTTTTTEVATSTTQATTTTSSSTTTTSTSLPPTTTTSTTQPPTTTTTILTPGCGLSQAAFCDTFDVAQGNGGRSGDLNPELWGVSRANTLVNVGQGYYNAWLSSNMVGPCGNVTAQDPTDVRVCGGRLVDSVADGGGQPILAMYPKQPFDFAGRTGKIVFDVSADSQGPHAAWPEFWITDQPIPAPNAGDLPAQFSYPRNGLGFHLGTDRCPAGQTGLYQISVVRNYAQSQIPYTDTGCVTKGSATGALNHFELRVSTNHLEVWATDATDAGGTSLRQIAVADNANLSFTKGVVWFEDVHYNADKFGTQGNHTFVWDNLGFDGPKTYRDLSFDVPDAKVPIGSGVFNLGYIARQGTATGFDTASVFQRQTPTGAIVTFNWVPTDTVVPDVRVNSGPWHSTVWPFDGATYGWRTLAVSVPLSETRTGVNRIEFRNSLGDIVLSNINLILVAGAPVP